jgi:N-acetyltransferase
MSSVVYSRKRLRALKRAVAAPKVPAAPAAPTSTPDTVSSAIFGTAGMAKSPSTFAKRVPKRPRSAWTQLHIDAGQRDISQRTCGGCGMVYAPGAPDDDALHRAFHAREAVGKGRPKCLAFSGWKAERVVSSDAQGRVIAVRPSDDAKHLSRVAAVDEYVALQLGGRVDADDGHAADRIVPLGHDAKNQNGVSGSAWLALLYISRDLKSVEGYVLAERVVTARTIQLSSDGMATAHEGAAALTGALCGVRRVWVAPHVRRRGIASKLLNAARENVICAHVVPHRHVVFTTPTQAGARFALAFIHGIGNEIYHDGDRRVIGVYSTSTSICDPAHDAETQKPA